MVWGWRRTPYSFEVARAFHRQAEPQVASFEAATADYLAALDRVIDGLEDRLQQHRAHRAAVMAIRALHTSPGDEHGNDDFRPAPAL